MLAMSKQSAQAELCLGGENGLGYVLWPMPWLHLELHNVAGAAGCDWPIFQAFIQNFKLGMCKFRVNNKKKYNFNFVRANLKLFQMNYKQYLS